MQSIRPIRIRLLLAAACRETHRAKTLDLLLQPLITLLRLTSKFRCYSPIQIDGASRLRLLGPRHLRLVKAKLLPCLWIPVAEDYLQEVRPMHPWRTKTRMMWTITRMKKLSVQWFLLIFWQPVPTPMRLKSCLAKCLEAADGAGHLNDFVNISNLKKVIILQYDATSQYICYDHWQIYWR